MSDNSSAPKVSGVSKNKTALKKRDENLSLQKTNESLKTEKPAPRRSERLNKPKEPEKLQHCAIRNESSKSSGISRKVRSAPKKSNEKESEILKPVPSKATYTGDKNIVSNDTSKQNQKIRKQSAQKVYPRKLGNNGTSKNIENKIVVPHEVILNAATTNPAKSRKNKKEPKNESVVEVALVNENEKEHISVEQEITLHQVVEDLMEQPDQRKEIPMDQEVFKKKEETHEIKPTVPQISNNPVEETKCQNECLEDGEIDEDNDLFYIDRKPQITLFEELQEDRIKPQKQMKIERTIKEIIDEACGEDDEPNLLKHTEYRRMFLPKAYTSYLDENSILRLFGRCDPSYTHCHYDANGVMIGSGVVRVHSSKEKLAVEHSKDQIWEAKRLLRVSPQKPDNHSDLMDMYIYNIPTQENTNMIVNSLKQQYEATNIQLFYKSHGEFSGCCRVSMSYENAVKLTRNRTYTLKNKQHSIYAFEIEQ